jgi:hypothetical protein
MTLSQFQEETAEYLDSNIAEIIYLKYIKPLQSDTAESESEKKADRIDEFFDKTWKIYPRKTNRIQAYNVYTRKVSNKDTDAERTKALYIYKVLQNQKDIWDNENGGNGRSIQYIPHFASWLNANFEDAKKSARKKQ